MMTTIQLDRYAYELMNRATVALERIATCMERGWVYQPESEEERTVREAQEAFDEMMAKRKEAD